MYRLNTYIGLGLLLLSCSQEEEKIQPQVNDLVESVYSSVIIQPDSLYRVHASINGILEKNFVDEGDLVTAGHLLMQVTNTRPKLQSENSKIALDLAKQNIHGNSNILQSLREEISAIELTFINDSVDYFRQQRLWNQQIGSQVALDNKKLKYELSRNTLIRLQDKYQQTKNQLNTYLKQAENNYVSSVVNAEDFRIKSNIKGKVYALYKNPGEVVNVQEPLALLGSATDFNIEMLVDEKDIV
nr:efflux transporter periplasmic adaptor subunit [Bacteroidota bacterium]